MKYVIIMKSIRTNAGLSQEKTAELLNLKRSTYKEFELQNSIIPLKHLNNFCNVFNVSIDYILGLTNNESYKSSVNDLNTPNIIKRLREFRKENKLTQIELAKFLNVANGTIANYENGRNFIGTPFLFTLCSKYKISADYLLGKIDSPKNL